MKAMPLPFEEFQGKGVLDFFSSTSASDSLLLSPPEHQQQQRPQKWNTLISKENCYAGSEPTSVLDTRRSPSPPRSTSTLSSSLGSSGGGNGGGTGSTDTTPTTTNTTGVAAASETTPSGAGAALEEEKCGLGMEDWESVLSESPGQEQSILRLIMADVDDPSLGLNKLLQSGSVSQEMEFNAGGFGVVDHGFGFEPTTGNLVSSIIDPSVQGTTCSDFPFNSTPNAQNNNNTRLGSASNPINPMFSASANNLLPVSLSPLAFHHQQQHQQQQLVESVDAKPQVFKPQVIMNQNHAHLAQNPALVMPLTYAQLQEHHVISQPPVKRLNTGAVGSNYPGQKVQFPNSGQELFVRGHEQQLQLLQQRPTMAVAKQKMMSPGAGDELANHQLQQALIDQLSKAAELIETGNPALAQGILARLNHHVSPLGKPFQRAAFYFKEALQLLFHNSLALPPFNLIFKIGAYKTFSEISPVLQFSNFTCNQAILEAMEGFSRIHVIDFDIGYGGQWASFMQELALRNGGACSLKITAFASPSTHDEFELGFTQENLKHFAAEINLAFELEIVSLEVLNSASWPLPLHISEGEAIAVNLPIGSFSSYPLSLPLVLRFVKQLSPKVVVSLERGCDRTDVPFPLQIIHAFQSYSGLLESLDAVNVNLDALQKIEKFLLQPGIEKIVLSRHRSPDRTPPWRSSFLNSGFSPLAFSNFTESQAECLVQRTPVRGFHIEKKQSSLVLCWQRKELISASAWRCC